MSKVITKIRRAKKAITIDYTDSDEKHNDEISLKSDAAPKEDFDAALGALTQDLIAICHLPKNYAQDLEITGLTLSKRGETPVVCLIGKKKLPDASSPFNIATPNRTLESVAEEGEDDPTDLLSDATRKRIRSVVECAEEYLNGQRDGSQLGLDD